MIQEDPVAFTDSILKEDTIVRFDSIEGALSLEGISYEGVLRHPFISDWSVFFIITLLLLFTSLVITSRKYLLSIFSSIFNGQTAQRLFRERLFTFMHPNLRFDLLFVVVTGVFIFQIEQHFYETLYLTEPLQVLFNSLLVLIFVYGKIFLYSLIGFIFDIRSETSEYIFYSQTTRRVIGQSLLPLTFLLYFAEGILFNSLLVLGVMTFLFFSVFSIYRGIRIIAEKEFSIYYLILYLCSLEILPLLIVWRILLRM